MRSTTLFMLATSLLLSASCSCGGGGGGANSAYTDNSHRHSHDAVVAPQRLDFAGEKVPIERGYIREAIERELLVTSNFHTATIYALCRTTRYFPYIESVLRECGIPDDFKYLAVAESSLNENAVSPAKASGLWQFLESVAKEYGLEVNDSVDERYHLEKSTRAACEYLLKSYDRFGSWSLVAASYNAGNSGVMRRLETQGVDCYWDLFLPEETMRYVPRILSFKILMSDTKRYGFDISKQNLLQPFKHYKTIVVDAQKIVWSDIAAEHKTTYRELRILNPWIRGYEHKNRAKKSYEVKIPTSRFSRLGY